MAGGKEHNVADSFIANVDEHCTGQYIKLTAEGNGSFTVWNQRNKFEKIYKAGGQVNRPSPNRVSYCRNSYGNPSEAEAPWLFETITVKVYWPRPPSNCTVGVAVLPKVMPALCVGFDHGR